MGNFVHRMWKGMGRWCSAVNDKIIKVSVHVMRVQMQKRLNRAGWEWGGFMTHDGFSLHASAHHFSTFEFMSQTSCMMLSLHRARKLVFVSLFTKSDEL